jgi:hypothetical protein
MKKPIFTGLALIAACALCCLPFILPILAGGATFVVKFLGKPMTLETILCSAAPAGIVAVLALWAVKAIIGFRRTKSCVSAACTTSGKCGCRS